MLVPVPVAHVQACGEFLGNSPRLVAADPLRWLLLADAYSLATLQVFRRALLLVFFSAGRSAAPLVGPAHLPTSWALIRLRQ